MNVPVEGKKKKRRVFRKILLGLVILFIVTAISHEIRYATNPDYARQHDAEVAARKEAEARQAEAKRQAEAAKEAAKLEAERLAEEVKQKELAELEQRKANNDELQKDFFERADFAMQQAEERWRNGTSRVREFKIPTSTYWQGMSATDNEAVSLVRLARSTLQGEVYDIWYDILTFRPKKDERRKESIDEAIGNLQKVTKLDDVSDSILAEAYWMIGICQLEMGENPEYFGGDKKKAAKSLITATDCFKRSSELGAVVGTTYLGLMYYKYPDTREEGVKLLLQASNEGFLPAKFLLGKFFINQPYYVRPEAWDALLAAAEADYPPAQESIMQLYGNFAGENQARALPWAYLSARNGNGSAGLLLVGMGAVTSPEEEEAFIKQAADQHIPAGEFLYGYRAFQRGIEENKRDGSMISLVVGQTSIFSAATEGHQQAIEFLRMLQEAKK